MKKILKARQKLRNELEVPPALRKFGSGWISGLLGLLLGLASLCVVLTLLFPGVLSLPELQRLHGEAWFRLGLHGMLLGAFVLAALSLALRKDRTLGTAGLAVTLLASMLGGAKAATVVADATPLFLGLDFFVLNVLFTGFLFVPLERLFPHRPEQALLREEWREDIFYYLVSSLMVQVLTYVTFEPSHNLVAALPLAGLHSWVGALPFLVQFFAIMLLTDLAQYWVHRAFHRIPWLWRFHSVHHSAQSMDWMAGARMHFFEILFLRSTTVIPMHLLGFSPTAMQAYILVVYLYSTFIHANLGWRMAWMEKLFVTPRFHHWHHGVEKEAIDVNFAIHFPFLDKLFGTHHLPRDQWPSGYGIEGNPVPKGYLAQFKHPFQGDKKNPTESSAP